MSPTGLRCARLERPFGLACTVRCARSFTLLLVACLAGAAAGHAQQNLSFEALDAGGMPLGWSASDGAEVMSDATVTADGEHSLQVTRASEAGATRVTQRVAAAQLRVDGDSARVQRLRLAGAVRTASAGATGALWLRIDGPRGPLFLDSYGYGREPNEERELGPTASAGDDPEWRHYELELPLPADIEEIAFGVSVRGAGTVWFDALELTAVATDSAPPATLAAARYVEAALALMREHSLRRAEVDWPVLRAQALEYARGATTPAEAHLAVRFAVRALGDRHSYLQSPTVTRALQTTAVANARTGAALSAPRARRFANVAHLHVPSFAGGTPVQQVAFAESLKNIIQQHDEAGVCGWAVDLRQNTGGNLWPMLAGLGPLLEEGELAASVYPDGRRVAVWYRDGQAGFGDYTQLRVRSPYRVRAAAPVALLLGSATASSAEVLAVALRSRAATRSFGVPTRGLSAGNRTFPLADGASLVLTVAATSDVAGHVFDGPVSPDEPVAPAGVSGTDGAADTVLDAAVAWLNAGDSCR